MKSQSQVGVISPRALSWFLSSFCNTSRSDVSMHCYRPGLQMNLVIAKMLWETVHSDTCAWLIWRMSRRHLVIRPRKHLGQAWRLPCRRASCNTGLKSLNSETQADLLLTFLPAEGSNLGHIRDWLKWQRNRKDLQVLLTVSSIWKLTLYLYGTISCGSTDYIACTLPIVARACELMQHIFNVFIYLCIYYSWLVMIPSCFCNYFYSLSNTSSEYKSILQ